MNLATVGQGTSNIIFQIVDNNGVSHFFISATAPYVNTFIKGNGAGFTIFGNAPSISISDTNPLILFRSGQDAGISATAASTLAIGTGAQGDASGTLNLANIGGTPAITQPSFKTGITNSGTGLKHGRVSTGSIGGAFRADVTLTFAGTAFADTNYTVVVSITDTSGAGLGMRVERVRTKNTGSIVVQVVNDAAGALTGTLEAVAIHD